MGNIELEGKFSYTRINAFSTVFQTKIRGDPPECQFVLLSIHIAVLIHWNGYWVGAPSLLPTHAPDVDV